MSQAQSVNHKQSRMKAARSLFAALIAITLAGGVAAHAQVVKGVGTPNTVPLWGNNSMLGNSIMSQSGSNVKVNGGLSATGNISAPNFSGTFFGNGSGLSNVNASLFGGMGPSGFAQLGTSNVFGASQTIDGDLTLTGSLNNVLILQGNLANGSTEQGANVIGGFGGNNTVPGNSVASGFLGATIAGGGGFVGVAAPNTVTGDWGSIGGGAGNNATRFGTVGGGTGNTASGFIAATVGGGRGNTASGLTATVGGGNGNVASGQDATVPGGLLNVAAGDFSFAAGHGAHASNSGSFVWTDNDFNDTLLSDTGPNQFVARATGGFTFYTDPTNSTGATLAPGSGSWSTLSDRNVKANFMLVDGEAILKRLAAMPIETWNYKAQADDVRHMGPMAQDFREAFGLGEDEKHISTVDAQGVALAAIQALYQEKQQEVSQLQDRLTALEIRLAAIESSK
jgi:hypothetical protein